MNYMIIGLSYKIWLVDSDGSCLNILMIGQSRQFQSGCYMFFVYGWTLYSYLIVNENIDMIKSYLIELKDKVL